MIITTHRKNTTNLKMFFETLGFKSWYLKTHPTCDELYVETGDREDFVSKVRDYVHKYGFVPYHFCVSFNGKGSKWQEEKVEFEGVLTETLEFTSVSGKFQLLGFESEQGNFLWKTYTGKSYTFDGSPLKVTGKFKATITGYNGEIVNLISNARIKQ